ncbi:purine catabolism regulatory protein [Streptoalloteichus tenebrarius]|uniref:Purine catabolism regulatory protein n=1 Tax=Streptoalloteichus tenebrarius (strain ATCC 17920 / DSM 40477 / JCM 4838 / CBS 697.72 / NBRC 16177 / NCIMB 11028 / NRRL B-12390 / A12253. 1 / ISP 5477) TaxID=1933 RepID=A0ABT1I066_STRSD|nr:PucR family transcriptional regulator [Streptoalloteichus tenebrarius]MCP2261177.1 purine catabolism regulatory protein [Streptoalloteichus tenebrarius]BFF02965.1 PucR family transcriptional regulator [Streptoalloteichus tenebrarius]
MYPTVAEVLALPVVRRGAPRVVAGSAGLGNRVRWAHAAEVADIAHLLRGGELVLTTGIALPDDEAGLDRYVADLARVGAAGLVVELVRRWRSTPPPALLASAERHGLPLVALDRETRFVSVTEAVTELVLDRQVAELRAAEQVHEIFTALTVSGAGPAEILREVARLAGLPVVLETFNHHVLAYDAAGADPAGLLADWAERSRVVRPAGRTGYDRAAGWLVTVVGARGDDWGRLVLVSPDDPPHRHVVVAERAASALALHRLVTRDRDTLERQAHRALLAELVADGPRPADLPTRAAALGVPWEGRRLVGVAVRPRSTVPTTPAAALATQEVVRDLAEATALAARRAKAPALVGVVDDNSVHVLLALPQRGDLEPVLERLAQEVHRAAAGTPRALPVVVGVGTAVGSWPDARRSLGEAAHVADAASRSPRTRPYHRLDDVRLRGLLHLLRDDERVTAFVERELGPLLARGGSQGARWIDVLRAYCEHGGNKSAAAAAVHLSRTAYYQQLDRIEQVLGVSLDDPESMLSLSVALLAAEVAGAAAGGAVGGAAEPPCAPHHQNG